MKHVPLLLLITLTCGCALVGPGEPLSSSSIFEASWRGAPVADMSAALGAPASVADLPDGRQEYRWVKEKSTIGPPRRDFGPGGKIKTRPGLVEYSACRTTVTTDAQGRVETMELRGDCRTELAPPLRR